MAATSAPPLPADHFIKIHQFTKTIHRDQYPSIDPAAPKLSQKGKTIIVTGSSQGIGKVSLSPCLMLPMCMFIRPSDRQLPLHLQKQMHPELSLQVAASKSLRQQSKRCSRSTPILMFWLSKQILLPKIVWTT
jgi:hypothetical protein